MTQPNNKWLVPAVVLSILLASLLGINQYHYGVWNHFTSLPWLYDLINPELYPHDPVIDQRESSPSFYNYLLKFLVPVFGGSIALMHFVLFVIFNLLTFVSFYQLARQLFAHKHQALYALIVLSFSFPMIGYIFLWDTILMERTIALPILLFALRAMLRERWLIAVLLQALAFNIHPLSSTYFIICSWLGVLLAYGFSWRILRYWPLLILLMVPVLYLKSLYPSDDHPIQFSQEWLDIMYLRNWHHAFPSRFLLWEFAKAALLTLSYFVLVARSGFTASRKNFFYGFGFGILILALLGTLFTEIYPVRLVIQFQFFRSFRFLALLTFALWAGLVLQKKDRVILLLGLVVILQYFYESVSKGAGATLVVVVAYYLFQKYQTLKPGIVAILAGLYLSLGVAAYISHGGMNIMDGKQSHWWYDVQDWMHRESARDALVIVPPSEWGFRVRSKRSIYVDWYDGTKAFFSEDYARTWYQRMDSLNCTRPDYLHQDFRQNDAREFRDIWETHQNRHSEGYAITFDDMELEGLPEVYSNKAYRIYRLHQ